MLAKKQVVYSAEPFNILIEVFGRPDKIRYHDIRGDNLLHAETNLDKVPECMFYYTDENRELGFYFWSNGKIEIITFDLIWAVSKKEFYSCYYDGTKRNKLLELLELLPPEWQGKLLFVLDLESWSFHGY